MTRRIAVLGLGNMGAGIARTLSKAGFEVVGFDPSPQAAERVGEAVRLTASTAEAMQAAETLILSLPSSREVEAVLTGPDGLTGLDLPPRLVIDASTADPLSTRKLSEALAAAGHSLLDAPVSGGPAGAASGQLAVFLGGSEDAAAKAKPVFDAIARKVAHVGPSGAGNVAKLVNNLLCATHLQIAGEALKLAQAAELDLGQVVEAVNGASGRSAVSEVNLPNWVLSGAFDSGFTLGLMAKDLGLALETARNLGLELETTALVERHWAETRDRLGAGEDFNRVADPAQPAGRPDAKTGA